MPRGRGALALAFACALAATGTAAADDAAVPADSAVFGALLPDTLARDTLVAFGAPPRDSVRFGVDAGIGTDWTNQIFYEQNFDSTAFTGRTTVSAAELRLVGLALARFATLRGPTAVQVTNDLRAGPDLVRDFARVALQHDATSRVRLTLDAEHDWRRDDTFDDRREDRRLGTIEGVRWRAPDHAWGARLAHRFESQRTAEGATALVPDFDYNRFQFDVDRAFGAAGSVSAGYGYAFRSFPDTSARDYREHTATALAFAPLSSRLGLELWADLGLRDAKRDSAIGDRFTTGGVDARLTVRLDDRWEVGGRTELRGTDYAEPTAAFFDYALGRYAVFARLRPDFARSIELRPELELARTPNFGGLPASSPPADRIAVAHEEYDQLALRLEYEDVRLSGWFGVQLGFGRRDYQERADRPEDLSAHSDFWLVQASGFLDLPLGRKMRARATADLWSELHDLSSDDLHSVFLSAEVRVPL